MSTVSFQHKPAERGAITLGWVAMIRDLLAFIGNRGMPTTDEPAAGFDTGSPRDDDGEEDVLEAFHPMLFVHYASPQI